MESVLDVILTLGIFTGASLAVALMSKERKVGFWTLFSISLILTPFVGIALGMLSQKRKEAKVSA